MSMDTSRPLIKDFIVIIAGALAAWGWNVVFSWWSHGPALQIYEQVMRHFQVNDVAVLMGTDALFALMSGLLAAELFIRLVRPDRYRPEALAVIAFLVAIFAAAWLQGEQAVAFFLHLPPLWLTLLCFGIRVGYGIKAQRKRLASSA